MPAGNNSYTGEFVSVLRGQAQGAGVQGYPGAVVTTGGAETLTIATLRMGGLTRLSYSVERFALGGVVSAGTVIEVVLTTANIPAIIEQSVWPVASQLVVRDGWPDPLVFEQAVLRVVLPAGQAAGVPIRGALYAAGI